MAAAEPNEPERIIKSELHQYANRRRTDGPYADNLDVDCLVVGAGFGGAYLLYEMRKSGYKTVLYDAGLGFGGTWRWNCYPGARVDSEVPVYEYSMPECYKDWYWTTNYPDWTELQAYFDHVDKVLDLSKDCAFETVVTGGEFSEEEGKWTIKTADGRTAKCKYLLIAAGFAAKRYIPEFKSLDKFKGIIHHSSFWPPEGVDVKGKRCAVIGTGASGVQIVQEWGPQASDLKVFQRTPNLVLPMGKRPLTKDEQDKEKSRYPELMDYRERCFAGMCYDLHERNYFDVSKEERRAHLERIWKEGGFKYWLANFQDYLFNADANREVYDFWAEKQRARVNDSRLKDILCPLDPPHAFGIKRPCLEQNYLDQFNRDNVDVVDISAKGGNGIEEFTATGIKTTDGKHYELDVIALATGFDVVRGGMTSMGLKSIHGKLLSEEWEDGAQTYLGTTISGYPNMWHLYGPHGPTLLSNGPSSVEVQGRWIRDCVNFMNRDGIKYIDPTPEATKEWKQRILDLNSITLFPTTRSTYMGGNVPGKKYEPVCYTGGIPAYKAEIRGKLPGWQGFRTVKA